MLMPFCRVALLCYCNSKGILFHRNASHPLFRPVKMLGNVNVLLCRVFLVSLVHPLMAAFRLGAYAEQKAPLPSPPNRLLLSPFALSYMLLDHPLSDVDRRHLQGFFKSHYLFTIDTRWHKSDKEGWNGDKESEIQCVQMFFGSSEIAEWWCSKTQACKYALLAVV
jgi:hypothetical protein